MKTKAPFSFDPKEAKDILIEQRESTGMNRKQFCEYFEIPYMTVSDWEHGKKHVPSISCACWSIT